VTRGHAFRTYDWNAATSLLDAMLSSYDLADEVAGKTGRLPGPNGRLTIPRRIPNDHQQEPW
jgi:4-hydroxyphenylacetate 3-monooxygenase